MQIRKNIFETNSSSSHSVVIDGGSDLEVPVIEGDEVAIAQGEYGWSGDPCVTWRDRASYALTYAKNYGRQDDAELLRKVISDQVKRKVEFSEGDGYIDHQSVDEAERIFINEDSVRNFVFGRGSSVEITNDNE